MATPLCCKLMCETPHDAPVKVKHLHVDLFVFNVRWIFNSEPERLAEQARVPGKHTVDDRGSSGCPSCVGEHTNLQGASAYLAAECSRSAGGSRGFVQDSHLPWGHFDLRIFPERLRVVENTLSSTTTHACGTTMLCVFEKLGCISLPCLW